MQHYRCLSKSKIKYSPLSSPGEDNEPDRSYSKCSKSAHNNRPLLGHQREQSLKKFFTSTGVLTFSNYSYFRVESPTSITP